MWRRREPAMRNSWSPEPTGPSTGCWLARWRVDKCDWTHSRACLSMSGNYVKNLFISTKEKLNKKKKKTTDISKVITLIFN